LKYCREGVLTLLCYRRRSLHRAATLNLNRSNIQHLSSASLRLAPSLPDKFSVSPAKTTCFVHVRRKLILTSLGNSYGKPVPGDKYVEK
jgi:hypothetical protein